MALGNGFTQIWFVRRACCIRGTFLLGGVLSKSWSFEIISFALIFSAVARCRASS
jgi:hypothetical protein